MPEPLPLIYGYCPICGQGVAFGQIHHCGGTQTFCAGCGRQQHSGPCVSALSADTGIASPSNSVSVGEAVPAISSLPLSYDEVRKQRCEWCANGSVRGHLTWNHCVLVDDAREYTLEKCTAPTECEHADELAGRIERALAILNDTNRSEVARIVHAEKELKGETNA